MSTASTPISSSILSHLRPVVGISMLAGIALSLSSGCRGAKDTHIALMERDLRQQEDYIYELEDIVVTYSEKLRESRCLVPGSVAVESHAQAPEPELAVDKPLIRKENAETPEPASDLFPEPVLEDLEIADPEFLPQDMEIPELEIEDPTSFLWQDPSSILPAAAEEELDADPEKLALIPDPVDFDASAEPEPNLTELPSDDEVEQTIAYDVESNKEVIEEPYQEPAELEQIVIAQVFLNSESDSEHGSLLTVVEALDTNGQPLQVQGEVSLMIRNNLEDKPHKLQRWDFIDEELAVSWQSSPLGDGLHLELPLKQPLLTEEPLELLARIVSVDGRKMLTRLTIDPTQLAVLETETGAQQLVAEAELVLTPAESQLEIVESESPKQQTAAIAQPMKKGATNSRPRWRPSLRRSSGPTAGYSSTVDPKGRRWTSQPLGGRQLTGSRAMASSSQLPVVRPAGATLDSGPARQPMWTAGRVHRASPSNPPAASTGPDWAPIR